MWNRKKTTIFSYQYLRNRPISNIRMFGYIDVNYLKKVPPEVSQSLLKYPVHSNIEHCKLVQSGSKI